MKMSDKRGMEWDFSLLLVKPISVNFVLYSFILVDSCCNRKKIRKHSEIVICETNFGEFCSFNIHLL